ncbi:MULTISPECIES: glycerol kinase GlpK [unclassified Aureimonas]|uniref:glycerol kinase GlpK n=1 Tax=unclassified Aureimonas TaxID=2615206 RepID=UPI0006FB684D|nr:MULTISPECIES: glycerol kinase GlpK [unclassified Aureimonas]KQT52303.1 glycerol kinase [Aureimonas sp. Leaf427]KQT61811.1 glycerol kinase [Aureimonas sp. Leaf460]
MSSYVMAIDQGTTSSRAVVFDGSYGIVGIGQQEFAQAFPRSGWVEHDPEEIWRTVVEAARYAIATSGLSAANVAAIGITNQRETTVIWDRESGSAIHPAIVWQDRRTADLCRSLKDDGLEAMVTDRTGLLLDPYFSATKIAWILDNVEGARERAEAGTLAFGTIDTFLLWRFTGGKVHATDATNAARTLLYDIRRGSWDDDLLRLFGIPVSLLPEVRDSAADFGTTEPSLLGASIAIRGMAGDQQAATVGQACFEPGMVKSTYGTGCFAVVNTGDRFVASGNRLLTTIAYQIDGRPTYALEGSIFVAGAVVQWLRDGLGIIDRAEQSGTLAAAANQDQEVYFVPAFTGLGAPWWDPDARGAIYGITRGTTAREIARAALESVCYQTVDLIDAIAKDWPSGAPRSLRVDGGMVASDWTMQRLADLLDVTVERPVVMETTALGAAWLAGYHAGVWPGPREFSERWRVDTRFEPSMELTGRLDRVSRWRDAVGRTLTDG